MNAIRSEARAERQSEKRRPLLSASNVLFLLVFVMMLICVGEENSWPDTCSRLC